MKAVVALGVLTTCYYEEKLEKVNAQNMRHVFKADVISCSVIFAGISGENLLTGDIISISYCSSSLSGAASCFLIPLPSKKWLSSPVTLYYETCWRCVSSVMLWGNVMNLNDKGSPFF